MKDLIDSIVATLSPKAAVALFGGSSSAIVAFLLSSQFFGLVGAAVALVGAYLGWDHKRYLRKADAKERAHRAQERDLRMELMRRSGQIIHPPPSDMGDLDELGADE